MIQTIGSALKEENINISRGSHPNGCEDWIVAGISDDMIRVTSQTGAKLIINLRFKEGGGHTFELVKVTKENNRIEIKKSKGFKEIWDELTTEIS